jgi:hypothetical protein
MCCRVLLLVCLQYFNFPVTTDMTDPSHPVNIIKVGLSLKLSGLQVAVSNAAGTAAGEGPHPDGGSECEYKGCIAYICLIVQMIMRHSVVGDL